MKVAIIGGIVTAVMIIASVAIYIQQNPSILTPTSTSLKPQGQQEKEYIDYAPTAGGYQDVSF